MTKRLPIASEADIIGAGPTGALLAILLQRRGIRVTLYEGRADPRGTTSASGRSINLALADRGIHALKSAGVFEDIVGCLMPMSRRLVHQSDGTEASHPYGQRPNEIIYSISRHLLGQALLQVATETHGVEVKFEHRLENVDFAKGTALLRDPKGNAFEIPMHPLLATDGAGSPTRHCMSAAGFIEVVEADLAHGYKELSIPASPQGTHRMAHDALHIWPRGNFMMIALPNVDGSFTATLFMPNRGLVSFEALSTPAAIEKFLSTEFVDLFPLMPDCITEFCQHPTGFLGTVYADSWSVRGQAALIGDSAHAIVPFHGQGMNCCFEDCIEFDACLQHETTWEAVFTKFFAGRKANTDAIAAMALENYEEMREKVADPAFRLQQALALELERRHPDRFIPRYSMVMFHREIPYAVAQRRGRIQARLLADLTAKATSLADVDYDRADREVHLKLSPIGSEPSPT